MGERLKQGGAKAKEFVGKMSKGVKIAIILVLILAIGAVVALSIVRANQPYTILFTGLTSEDMTAVLGFLDGSGVTDYRVTNNDTILVKQSQEQQLRAQIYLQGYPTSGFNYGRYLDNVGMLSSESDRATLKLYELMDRLSATVRLMDGVKDAQVNITEGSDTSFILSDNVVAARASVTVEMLPGRQLTDQLASAIRNMVSHSAEGLEISEVVVQDTAGNEYGGGSTGFTTLSSTAELKLALEAQVDNNIRAKILEQLVPMFGLKNLSVSVSSSVDVSDTYTETLKYIEPEWAQDGSTLGQGIIGSRVWGNYLIRDGAEGAGGVVGTTTNADLNEYVVREGDLTGAESEINTSGEINYDVGYTRTQTRPLGTVTDLSVAIAINRNVSETAINTSDLVPLVARASGINREYEAEKIEIIVYPFYVEETASEPADQPAETGVWMFGLPYWVLYAAIAGLVLFLILLIVILSIRGKVKKKKAAKKAEEEQMQRLASYTPEQFAALTPEELSAFTPEQIAQFTAEMAQISSAQAVQGGADIMDLHAERSMELRKDVRQFAEDNPAIAAQMIKNWLRGGEEHG